MFSLMSVDGMDPDSSGIGQEDPEMMTLIVSGIFSNGFLLSWESKNVHDSFTVECRDSMGLWDVVQIQLPGDAIGARVEGLKASTAYEVRLYGVNGSQRTSPRAAVAVTGIYHFVCTTARIILCLF